MTRDENTYCGKHAEAQVIQSQFKMPTRSFQSIAQILSHSTVLSMKLFSSIISRHWNISKQVHLHARFLEIYGNLRCPTPEQSLHWSRYTWSKDIESYGIRSTLSTGQGNKARWWESQIMTHDRPLEVTWVVGSESALQGRSQPARNLNSENHCSKRDRMPKCEGFVN